MAHDSGNVFALLRRGVSRCKRILFKLVGPEPAKPEIDPGLRRPDDLSLTGDGGKLKLSWKGDQNRFQVSVFNLTTRKWCSVRTTKNALVLELPSDEYMVKIRSGPMGRPPLISRWSSPLFFKWLPDNSFQRFSPQSSLIQYEVDADLLIPGRIDYSWTCVEGRTEVRLQWEGGHPRYTLGLFDQGEAQWDYRACLEAACVLVLDRGKYVIRVRTGPLKAPVRIGPWSGELCFEVKPDGSLIELEPIVRLVAYSVDHRIPVPENLALTAEASTDGRLGIRLCWEGEADDYQLALLNMKTKKWLYRECADTGYTTGLDPGSYLAKVRSLTKGPPRRAGHWSTIVNFAIDDRMRMISGLAAKAFSEPTRHAFYDNIFRIKEALAAGESELITNPLALSIILEGRGCNLRCVYCSHILDNLNILRVNKEFRKALASRLLYTAGRTVGTSQTLISSMKEIIPSLQTMMFGGGEPLMYPEFKQLLKMMQANPDTQISVCTNGNLIDDELIELILNGNFPWLRISMDGATKETYEAIRQRGDFDRVCRTIREIVKRRGDRNKPKVQINFVVTKTNYHEMIPFIELAENLGAAAVNFKSLIRPSNKNHPLHDKLFSYDHLEDKDVCREIINIMYRAGNRAQELGVTMTREAVTPAIYNRYPNLNSDNSENSPTGDEKPTRRVATDSTPGQETACATDCSDNLLHAKVYKHLQQSPMMPAREELEVLSNETLKLVEEEDDSREFQEQRDIDWKNVFCHMPFINLSAGHYRVHFCCYAKREFNTHFVEDEISLKTLWNHPKLVKARRLMHEGRADLVCKNTCPHLIRGGVHHSLLS